MFDYDRYVYIKGVCSPKPIDDPNYSGGKLHERDIPKIIREYVGKPVLLAHRSEPIGFIIQLSRCEANDVILCDFALDKRIALAREVIFDIIQGNIRELSTSFIKIIDRSDGINTTHLQVFEISLTKLGRLPGTVITSMIDGKNVYVYERGVRVLYQGPSAEELKLKSTFPDHTSFSRVYNSMDTKLEQLGAAGAAAGATTEAQVTAEEVRKTLALEAKLAEYERREAEEKQKKLNKHKVALGQTLELIQKVAPNEIATKIQDVLPACFSDDPDGPEFEIIPCLNAYTMEFGSRDQKIATLEAEKAALLKENNELKAAFAQRPSVDTYRMENSAPPPMQNVTALEKPGERKRPFLAYFKTCQEQNAAEPRKGNVQDTYVSHNSAPVQPLAPPPNVSFGADRINKRLGNQEFLAKNYTAPPSQSQQN